MDDRFDLMLNSKAATLPGNKFYMSYSRGRYFTVGNDGNHFNDSINKLPNNAAPVAVLNGIHYASDHCPIVGVYFLNGTSSIVTQSSGVADRFNLSQNYPNPFNPVTTINFDVPVSTYVNLTVYDINGRQVETLVNGNKSEGKYSVNFDASMLPSGTYIYRLAAGNYSAMRKMVVVK
jgi:hypothetical protein